MKIFKMVVLFCLILTMVVLWLDKKIETFPAALLALCFVILLVEKIFCKKEKNCF